MTITYQVERLEHDQGEDLFLVKSIETGHELEDELDVIELEALDDHMTVRALDINGYECLWTLAELTIGHGRPLPEEFWKRLERFYRALLDEYELIGGAEA